MMRIDGQVAALILLVSGLGFGGCKGASSGSSSDDDSTDEQADDEATDDGVDDGGTDSGDGTNTSTDTGDDGDDDEAALPLSPLAAATPRGLGADSLQPRLTVPISTDALGGGLRLLDEAGPGVGVDAPTPFAQMLLDTDKLLDGSATHCLARWAVTQAVFNPPSGNTCFFDGAIRSASGMDGEPQTEACVVITARREAGRAQVLLEAAIRLQLAMLCEAQKAKRDVVLPAVGDTLDLKAEMLAAVQGVTPDGEVTYGDITRLPDDGAQPVYRTDILVRTHQVDGGGMDLGYAVKELHLVHSPAQDDSGAYHGVIWMKQGPEGSDPVWFGVSYARAGTAEEPRLKFEVRRFTWLADASPTLPSGLLDLSAGAVQDSAAMDYGSFPGGDPAIETIRYLNFDLNPLDGAGSVSYFENDGNFNAAARGIVTSFNRGDDGTFSGCGVAGQALSGLSVRKALLEGTPLTLPKGRYYQVVDAIRDYSDNVLADESTCTSFVPQTDADQAGECWRQTHGQSDDLVYVQCFKQNADGAYVVDTALDDADGNDGFDLVDDEDTLVAPYNVLQPDLADAVTFAGDVRPLLE